MIICELGSTSDYKFINKVLQNNPDILFHASAYKHVGLIEENKIEGIKNNIRSTLCLCKTAYEFKYKIYPIF